MTGKNRQSEAVELYRPAGHHSFWGICFGVSMFVHLVLVGALLFSPLGESNARMIDRRNSINVDLVAMNPEISAPPDTEQSGQKTAATPSTKPRDSGESQDAQPIPVKKTISKNIPEDYELKMPEPKVKTSLKKKTFEKEKVIADAVRQMAEKSKRERPKSVEERIAQLAEDVGSQKYQGRLSSGDENVNSGGGVNSEKYGPMEIYQAEVAVLMKHNWAFNPEMAGSTEGLETRLVIKILPDGTVSEIWYEKRSGNPYLDESAYKTVKKASPLPPLPEDYPHYHLVLGFTPSGLAQ